MCKQESIAEFYSILLDALYPTEPRDSDALAHCMELEDVAIRLEVDWELLEEMKQERGWFTIADCNYQVGSAHAVIPSTANNDYHGGFDLVIDELRRNINRS